MLNKKKISREILGLTGASFIVAVFFYGFIRVMSNTIVVSYCDSISLVLTESQEWEIAMLIQSVGLVASAVIFVVLFLFLVGEKIENTVEELQTKEKNLIRSLSHDIRTPLTSILAYSEYMQTREAIEKHEMDEYICMMQRKAEQMKSLTDQLLDGGVRNLEKIENGKFLMEQLADEWASTLENRFKCEIDLESCPNFVGEFDIRELRRIFDNLVSNVEKYADTSAPVYLEIKEQDSCLLIKQKNAVKKDLDEVESNGIGIASIKRIAQNYNGDATAHMDEGCFWIEIIFRIL